MSRHELSEDTKAVLLLCGRFGGERQEPFSPLSTREYGDLAKWLAVRNLRPLDLLTDTWNVHATDLVEAKLEGKRIDFLLGRGTALAIALERWGRGGLWVISRGDSEFPKRLWKHFKNATPPVLYGAGDKGLLNHGGLAIVGSRDASETALEFTRAVAARCAREHLGVISGGARGIDSAAMQGATEAGGVSIGVLAGDLLKASVNRQNRIGLQDGHLVLVSPFFPEAGFQPGNAMARNRYIYTMGDQALIVDSANGSGGTWSGAVEGLKNGWIPIYVRLPGDGEGNAALVRQGGRPFAYSPYSSESLAEFFAQTQSAEDAVVEAEPAQQPLLDASVHAEPIAVAEITPLNAQLPTTLVEEAAIAAEQVTPSAVDGLHPKSESLDMFSDFIVKLGQLLSQGPSTEEEIVAVFCLNKSQAKAWLKRATETKQVEKLKSPARYALSKQSKLFESKCLVDMT